MAEGVETEQVLTALKAIGCDIGQGYHISRPLALDAFTAWYRTRRADRPASA